MSEIQEKIQKLQSIEQSLQSFSAQHQSVRSQLLESESALRELEKGENAYKIVGSIMVRQSREKLVAELKEKELALRSRLKKVQDQENGLREEAHSLQQEIMKVKQ